MLAYVFARLVVFLMSLLPWSVVYAISRFFYVLLFYVLRIRRKMVAANLRLCFPDKSPLECKRLEKDIYRNFLDVMCENIKSYSMKPAAIKAKTLYENPEVLSNYFQQGKDVIIYFVHYGNWEWAAALGLYVPNQTAAIYKPLHNRYVNNYIHKRRTPLGMNLIPHGEFPRFFFKHRRKDKLCAQHLAVGMIADQRPGGKQATVNVDFMNRDTRFMLGPEKVACHHQLPIVYLQITRTSRGCYSGKFIPMGVPDKADKEGEMTKRLAGELEKQVIADPASWFWLHNRWK